MRLGFFGFIGAVFTLMLCSCDMQNPGEKAAEEGILIVGNSNEPKALDPQLVSGVLESNILRSLFEGLAGQDVAKDGVSVPGVASRWESSADFKQWTFHLQPEAKWSDGVKLTAHDFVFAYERMLTPALGASYAEMLYFIEGAEEFNKNKTQDFSTVKVWAEGDSVLKVVLKNPMPFLPELTKHFTWYPVPKHVVLRHGGMTDLDNEWTKTENLVSNGPFKLKSRIVTHSIEA